MQTFFIHSTDEVVPPVCALATEWMNASRPIVLVEYEDSGPTVQPLLDLITGYEHLAIVEKACANGAPQVLEACCSRAFNQSKFVVCGVAYGCCVAATARELAVLNTAAEVTVRVDCTDAARKKPHEYEPIHGVMQMPA